MKKFINSKSSSFKVFDIKYTDIEKQTISKFKIENESEFYYHGNYDSDIFIKSIGNNTNKDIKIIKKIIYKLLNKLTKACDKYYIEVDINITLKDIKSTKRWHIDAFPNNSKFVTTLIGPSTLFIDDSDIKSRNIYFKIQEELMTEYTHINSTKWEDLAETYNKYNKILNKKLKKCKIVQPNNNQGVIFLTDIPANKSTFAGIHSEPLLDENRFFISVLCYNNKII